MEKSLEFANYDYIQVLFIRKLDFRLRGCIATVGKVNIKQNAGKDRYSKWKIYMYLHWTWRRLFSIFTLTLVQSVEMKVGSFIFTVSLVCSILFKFYFPLEHLIEWVFPDWKSNQIAFLSIYFHPCSRHISHHQTEPTIWFRWKCRVSLESSFRHTQRFPRFPRFCFCPADALQIQFLNTMSAGNTFQ